MRNLRMLVLQFAVYRNASKKRSSTRHVVERDVAANTEALVNTVNCVGGGRGIAAQFKRAYPKIFSAYQQACKRHEVQPGRVLIVETGHLANPRWVINFPTKRHWRGDSRIADIDAGLAALVADVRRLGIESIAARMRPGRLRLVPGSSSHRTGVRSVTRCEGASLRARWLRPQRSTRPQDGSKGLCNSRGQLEVQALVGDHRRVRRTDGRGAVRLRPAIRPQAVDGCLDERPVPLREPARPGAQSLGVSGRRFLPGQLVTRRARRAPPCRPVARSRRWQGHRRRPRT
jgi:hypothetical protein